MPRRFSMMVVIVEAVVVSAAFSSLRVRACVCVCVCLCVCFSVMRSREVCYDATGPYLCQEVLFWCCGGVPSATSRDLSCR